MIKIAYITNNNSLKENNLFDPIKGRDGILRRNFVLKEYLFQKGIDLSTNDINNVENSQGIFCNDPKHLKNIKLDNKLVFGQLMENRYIRPDFYFKENQDLYTKIFTFSDKLIDNIKFIKVNFSRDLAKKHDFTNKKKLLTTIISNKVSIKKNENELYSKRIEILNFFEHNHPESFKFFGYGWNNFKLNKSLLKELYFNFFSSKQLYYKNYEGVIVEKDETLRQYKFAFAIENYKNEPGYISEKVIDCLCNYTIPIYMGANNIEEYIPKACFINIDDFNNLFELFHYVSTMDVSTYNIYLNSINNFLNNGFNNFFSIESNAKIIANNILKSFNKL